MFATPYDTNTGSGFAAKAGLAIVLALWFVLAAVAGMSGILTTGADNLARPVLLSVVIPIAAFLALYFGSNSFRSYILTRDIRVLTMLQSWRIIGFTFLMLYAWGTLPGLLDFVAAAGTATLASGAVPGLLSGPLTSAPMEVWPLSLFPSFIVPLFAFLHLSVLFQLMEARSNRQAA